MDDKLTFTLKSPITDEQWDKITDADFEHTNHIWFETKHGKVEFVKASVQPEYKLDEWCADCKEYDIEKHCCPRFNRVIRTAMEDAKPEVKPIEYQDCSNALLKMWMENVLTYGEYYRIQEKLNSSDFAKERLPVPEPPEGGAG